LIYKLIIQLTETQYTGFPYTLYFLLLGNLANGTHL
jgi:hypothetical protein